MVKSIIKRIIIGVGIALVLMAIKGNLLIGAKAMTIQNSIPTAQYLSEFNGTQTQLNGFGSFQVAGVDTNFYGRQWGSAGTRLFTYWTFTNNSSLDISSPLDIHFLVYIAGTSRQDEPFRVFITDNNKNVYSCNIHSSITLGTNTQYERVGYLSDVRCENIALSTKNFKVYLSDLFSPDADGYLGISKLSLYKHSSSDDKLDAIQQEQEQTNTILEDSSTDNPNSDLTNMNNKIATNSSISQILTLPIQLYQNILNSVSGSCSSFSLGALYNHNLTLPCINLQNLLGSTLYGIIDILISGLFILSFRKKMVDIFNHLTSLNDRGNELE